MQLKDIMTTHVRGISEDESVCEAARAMERLCVGSLPVFRDGHAVGIITDRDITVRGVAAECDCAHKPVKEVMSTDLFCLPETTDVQEASRQMSRRQLRRLLVTGNEGEIVGIVAVGDIAAKVGQHQLSADLIESVSVPAEPNR